MIQEFELALECIDTLLKAEPGNTQAKDLKHVIEDRLKKSTLYQVLCIVQILRYVLVS